MASRRAESILSKPETVSSWILKDTDLRQKCKFKHNLIHIIKSKGWIDKLPKIDLLEISPFFLPTATDPPTPII